MELTRKPGFSRDFAELIDECNTLTGSSGQRDQSSPVADSVPLPSLLDQCHRLTERVAAGSEPIRTVHHFACTGGTLILKCLSSMPNTGVLSEVEPHSRMPLAVGHKFFPTDLTQLLRLGVYPTTEALEAEIFLNGFSAIYNDSLKKGLRLIVRDHAHSKYCLGTDVSDSTSLRELLLRRFPVKSIVTVRHPLDSYLSLVQNDWLHFEPQTLEEYCLRYHRFLQDHADCMRFKYEDFVEQPDAETERMCEALALPFNQGFGDVFFVYRLSGDSGRSSDRIGKRERRPVPDQIQQQRQDSGSYKDLCAQLGYEP